MQEGVIKFDLSHTSGDLQEAKGFAALNAWREILWELALIGQTPERYDGYGFGNVSIRIDETQDFLISGTQTGHLQTTGIEHYAAIRSYDLDTNKVSSEGPVKPSSESLTHAVLYQFDPTIRCILHVHSPEIWKTAHVTAMPVTEKSVEYGTPGMAREVTRLLSEIDIQKQKIFSMGGHQDGVISFGKTPEDAGITLVAALAKALQLSR